MKEACRTIFKKDYVPFALLAAAMLVLHLLVPGLTKDDRYYWNVLNEQNTISYLAENWNGWTSRLFIEGVAIWVEHLPMAVWKLLDTLIYTMMGVTISALFFRDHKRQLNFWLVGLMLAYPFVHMSTAGWMTTTITYLWPLAAGLGACLYFVRVLDEKKLRWYEYPIYTVCVLYAGSLEQMSAVMTAVTFLFVMYLTVQEKHRIFPWVMFLLSVLNLAAAVLCPGNAVRTASEIRQCFTDYRMLSLTDKIQLGYSSTLEKVFFSPDLPFLFLFILVTVTVFCRSRDLFYRAAAAVPLCTALLLGPLRGFLGEMFPGFAEMKKAFGKYGAVELGSFDWKRSYVPIILLGTACVALLVSVYGLYGDCARGLLALFILILGFGTRVVMGFSPTIWKSSDRTYLFFLFSALIVSGMILHDFYDIYQEKVRKKIGWMLGIGGIAAWGSCLMLMG